MKPKRTCLSRTILPACAILAIAGAQQAAAAITYVDAVHGASGNTFATGGSLGTTTWLNTTNLSSPDSDQWMLRSPFANGGQVYQAWASPVTSIPELTTQITGLTNGTTYDVWAFFWDLNTTAVWTISAGLTSGSLPSYANASLAGTTTVDVTAASALTFSNTVLTTEADRTLFGVKVAQAVATGGQVSVFIDRNIALDANTNRVWYDGVGFEAVPEPSSALLGGLGLLALLRRRRA